MSPITNMAITVTDNISKMAIIVLNNVSKRAIIIFSKPTCVQAFTPHKYLLTAAIGAGKATIDM